MLENDTSSKAEPAEGHPHVLPEHLQQRKIGTLAVCVLLQLAANPTRVSSKLAPLLVARSES